MSMWQSWSVELAWKAALVMVLATAVTALMRRRSAAERHAVWLLAVACVLMLPLLTRAAPSWTVRVPVKEPVVSDVVPFAPPAPAPLPLQPAPSPAPVAPRPPSVEAAPLPAAPVAPVLPSRSALLLMVWGVGVLGVLSSLGLALVRVQRLCAGAVPLQDARLVVRARAIALSQGIERPVRLLEGDAHMMPLTCGLIRPTLLLPSSAAAWTVARQEAVLRHELAHVRRRDSLTQLLAGIACALHWYNPLVWLAARRMCIEREHACDDAVLAAGSRATDYAAELLDIARSMRVQRSTALAAIAMARPSQLRSRLAALLEDRRRSERVSVRLLVPAWLGAALLLTPLSTLTPVLAERDEPLRRSAAHSARVPAEVTAAVASARREGMREHGEQQAPASQLEAGLLPRVSVGFSAGDVTDQEDCLSGKHTQIMNNRNDERLTTKWSGAGCTGEMVLEGTPQFNAEFTRITGFSRSGYMRLQMTEGDTERRVVLRDGGYEYSVNGSRREFDAAAQRWLDETLLFMFRRLGFMAEERAKAIVERGGAPALLAEVEVLRGDYVRAAYLGVLIQRGRLDESTLRRVLNLAGTTIGSDYYRTNIVTSVAGNYELTEGIRSAYIEAVSGIDSDYYKHSAFSTLLSKGRLSSAQTAAVLAESKRIDSDYYRAALLTELNGRYGTTPEIRAAYLDAAASMDSDHYKSEVLSKLMSSGGLGAADLARLADAAATIDSDHYRVRVLHTFIGAGALNDATLQRAFIRAARGIDSDHYLQNLLSDLAKSRSGAGALGLILEAAGSIDSDHYRSTLLADVAREHRLEGANRTQFMKLMDEIDSETYRGRVASALLRQSR